VSDLLEVIHSLGALAQATPATPGVVYRHFDDAGVLLYIGSTDKHQFRSRQFDHAKDGRWWRYVDRIEQERTPSRRDAYLAETPAIAAERPVFNRQWSRGDQPHREAEYVRSRAGRADRWPPLPAGRGRGEVVDAMLRDLCRIAPDAPSPLPRTSLYPVLDLGEYLMREHLATTGVSA
jgi:hypothetical protein